MIDLETLGVGPRAAILTIGWVKFDPHSQEMSEPYRIHVDVASCIERGMIVNDSTVRWWMIQDEEARKAQANARPVDLAHALTFLSEQLSYEHPIQHVWGNGANFDISILETAYELCGMEIPWKFYDVRCYRTIKSLSTVPRISPEIPHDAGFDAKAQAQHLQEIFANGF